MLSKYLHSRWFILLSPLPTISEEGPKKTFSGIQRFLSYFEPKTKEIWSIYSLMVLKKWFPRTLNLFQYFWRVLKERINKKKKKTEKMKNRRKVKGCEAKTEVENKVFLFFFVVVFFLIGLKWSLCATEFQWWCNNSLDSDWIQLFSHVAAQLGRLQRKSWAVQISLRWCTKVKKNQIIFSR